MTNLPGNISLKDEDDYESAEDAAKEVYNYLRKYVQVLGYNKQSVTLYKPGDYKNECWSVEISIDSLGGWTHNIKDKKSMSSKPHIPESSEPEIAGFEENNNFEVQCKNSHTLEFYDI